MTSQGSTCNPGPPVPQQTWAVPEPRLPGHV